MRAVTFVSILLANIAILIASSYRNRKRREHDSEPGAKPRAAEAWQTERGVFLIENVGRSTVV